MQVPRIGCVPYLNARPLLEGIGLPVIERVPAQLHNFFLEGKLDVALLSSVDVLNMHEPAVVDGISISCRGPVQSVLLAYKGEIKDLISVQLDPASHTSNYLVQIVLGEFLKLNPNYVQIERDDDRCFPAVVIGDPALHLSTRASNHGLRFLDLGEEWVKHTGLPFVFALWVLAKDYTDKKSISGHLRATKDRGLASLDRIASFTKDPEFSKSYLGSSIRYGLGQEEKRGLGLFRELLNKLKPLDKKPEDISFSNKNNSNIAWI